MRQRDAMRQEARNTEHKRLISASEVACWCYCPEQWRLSYPQGKTPLAKSRTAMRAGERHHAVNSGAERVATTVTRAGNRLVALTLVTLLLVVALLVAFVWR